MAGARRTYRLSIGALLWVLLVVVVSGVVLLGRLYSRTDLVGAGLVWTGVGVAAFGALLMIWLARSATVVTDAGIRVMGLFRSRFYPWVEIADIQTDQFGRAVLYDRDLRRIELPYLDRRRLGEAFLVELSSLTAQWASGRGPGWRPRAAELAQQAADLAKDAEDSQRRANIFTYAVLGAVLSFVAIMVIMVTNSSSAITRSPMFELLMWPGMLVIPVVVFLLIYMFGRAGRRARQRRR